MILVLIFQGNISNLILFPTQSTQLVEFPSEGRNKGTRVLRNVQCVEGAYGESAFEELDEIFYIVQPNNIFKSQINVRINKN